MQAIKKEMKIDNKKGSNISITPQFNYILNASRISYLRCL
jgi:hypothetical protein